MRVSVGSQNPVKLQATKQAFTPYFDQVEISPIQVTSGVQPFPMSQQETLKGAQNRALQAWEKDTTRNFAVGIEAGIHSVDNHFFVQAFAAVKKEELWGLGCSVAFEVSASFITQLDPSSDHSKHTIDHFLGRTNLFQREGVVGVLTQNQLTRTQILRDAVICALPRFLQPQFF